MQPVTEAARSRIRTAGLDGPRDHQIVFRTIYETRPGDGPEAGRRIDVIDAFAGTADAEDTE